MKTTLELIDQGLSQAASTRLMESAQVTDLLLDLRQLLTAETSSAPYDWSKEDAQATA